MKTENNKKCCFSSRCYFRHFEEGRDRLGPNSWARGKTWILNIVSYNASAVEIHNATSSLVRFENKNNFFYIEETLYSTKFRGRRIGPWSFGQPSKRFR
jgi:hypothetical protein